MFAYATFIKGNFLLKSFSSFIHHKRVKRRRKRVIFKLKLNFTLCSKMELRNTGKWRFFFNVGDLKNTLSMSNTLPTSYYPCSYADQIVINPFSPEICGCYFKCLIVKCNSVNDTLVIFNWIGLKWMPKYFTRDKLTLVEVMAWCHQAPSHYLNQCKPSLWHYMASLGQNEFTQLFLKVW